MLSFLHEMDSAYLLSFTHGSASETSSQDRVKIAWFTPYTSCVNNNTNAKSRKEQRDKREKH